MRFEPRLYQAICVKHWIKHCLMPGKRPVIAAPTGSGKSVILGEFLVQWFDVRPDDHILVLSHTQEIVEQDYEALLEYFPSFGCGVYSSGLGKKQIRKVTVAGIQSVFRHPEKFKHFNIMIVDEAHTVSHKSGGMYRDFFKAQPDSTIITGMSATVFRTGHGYIYEGKDTLFNDLAFDLTSIKKFNRLVKEGYLTKLISKHTKLQLDSSKVKQTAGEYNVKDLARAHDQNSITVQAVNETVKEGKKYKKWLVFAIDTDHAHHICEELKKHGITARELHTKMEGDRKEVIQDFKDDLFTALVSVGMVTTGFDAPNVDLIVMLRPTKSSVLWVQMVGRGLRTAPGKSHCLVLDFAGNTASLGPINNPVIPHKKGEDGEGVAPTKVCPKCHIICFASVKLCPECGHLFPFESRLLASYDKDSDIIQKDKVIKKVWHKVRKVSYFIHSKAGKPDSLKVVYFCKIGQTFTEWVCLNHEKTSAWAKRKADAWVTFRDPTCTIFDTQHVYRRTDKLKIPTEILVDKTNPKFPSIVDSKFSLVHTYTEKATKELPF